MKATGPAGRGRNAAEQGAAGRTRSDALKTKHEKAIQKTNDVIEQGVEATLASATAFGLGIWQTRADHQKLLGVPVDLAVIRWIRRCNSASPITGTATA